MSELDAVVQMLKWIAATGDRQLGHDCRDVMQQNYRHLRRDAWAQLTPDEQQTLQTLMR